MWHVDSCGSTQMKPLNLVLTFTVPQPLHQLCQQHGPASCCSWLIFNDIEYVGSYMMFGDGLQQAAESSKLKYYVHTRDKNSRDLEYENVKTH